MVGYYVVPSGVRPFARPSALFLIDNEYLFMDFFFQILHIHIVIGGELYEIVDGQNQSIFNRVIALVYTAKNSFWRIIPLLFLISQTLTICLSLTVTYCDKEPLLRLFQFRSYLPLIEQKKFFDL